eukprot:TRINITY_DN1874_c0_g2_i3.p2 TRINITY_DN1874_c0_g2~~TRINITY_DN1874_c0_g2_i3.p2  ORF type:complete len:220 (-),score=43.11 TRINITY_DN1874_c0_g2_i3:3104-3763(-)
MSIVSAAQAETILLEAWLAITTVPAGPELRSRSVHNCHFKGLSSLWLTDTLRVFVAKERLPGTGDVDDCRFLVHNHRYPLISVPVYGVQHNIIYKEHPGGVPYRKFRFHSGLFRDDRRPLLEPVGVTRLKAEPATVDQPWFMNTSDVHRVYWPDGVIALLKEHRQPDEINTATTDAYLVHDAYGMPCEEGLYASMGAEDYDRLVDHVRPHVLHALQRLL